MSPNVLFVGSGKGSWAIRGIQVAKAIGGRCTVSPTPEDWHWASVIVLVKRAIDAHGPAATASRRPIVWDVLDFWQQPEENQCSELSQWSEVKSRQDEYGVSVLIGATRRMADAIGGVYLSHHSRPRLCPTPLRESVSTVAYEGTPKYLGQWHAVLDQACADRGWRFVVNPSSLAEADIVVSLRDGKWDGEICRQWKSGVKYVNALAAGRPVVTQRSAAFSELGTVGAIVEHPGQIGSALDEAVTLRSAAYADGCARSYSYSLVSLARVYRSILESVVKDRAA